MINSLNELPIIAVGLMVTLQTHTIRDVSSCCFRRPDNLDNIPTLHSVVASNRIIGLDARKLIVF